MNEKTTGIKKDRIKEQGMKCLWTLLAIAAMIIVVFQYRERKLQENLADNILRFHVIANSDTREDQQLKIKVRDAIGTEFSDEFAKADTLLDSIAIAKAQKSEIETCAKETIQSQGYTYPVQVEVKETKFPLKSYGAYTFPPGTYQAVEVIIGTGEGHNWWCVMYPNLCFTDTMYQVEDAVTEEELKALLTEDTFEELVAQGEIHVKLKVVEELKEILHKKTCIFI